MDPWQILDRGGIPLSRVASGPPPTPGELAHAVHAVRETSSGRQREALCAFVRAWSQGWPSSFAEAFGQRAAEIMTWSAETVEDPDRYLKLRRIARANLAAIL